MLAVTKMLKCQKKCQKKRLAVSICKNHHNHKNTTLQFAYLSDRSTICLFDPNTEGCRAVPDFSSRLLVVNLRY